MSRTQDKTNKQSFYSRESINPDFVRALEDFKKKYEGKKTVLICEPSIGSIDYQAHESCIDVIIDCIRYEEESDYKFFKTSLGRLLVAYSREKFAEVALDFGFDYLFFMDDDHIWPQDIFRRLEKHIEKYDIVAPLCVQRKRPYYPVIYKTKFTESKVPGEPSYFDNEKMLDWKKGDLVEPDAIGFGAAIIKIDLLRKMPKPWFFSMAAVGEDILFCMKARQIGATILVDTSVDTGHLKDREPATWRDYERESKSDNAKLSERKDETGSGTESEMQYEDVSKFL